jgi:23S rRNA (cytosine1962-C5)-methyltransferase
MTGRLAVRLSRDAERQVRGGHPWVFDSSVREARPTQRRATADPGDLAVVFDDRRRFVAVGLWDPDSPIRIRVLQQGEQATIDRSWFEGRIAAAADLRAGLAGSQDTTGYRLVSGENDGLPGLVVDRYADTLVVKLYTAAWFAHLDDVLAGLANLFGPQRVVLRLARSVAASQGMHDGQTLLGEPPTAPVEFLERGLRFEADVVGGQKTGFFLDQRDNRAAVRQRASGARVLDVFSCSGGFSVNAAAGGAAEVTSVDISPGAIRAAERNMALNRHRPAVARCRHELLTGDATEVMRSMVRTGRRFDVVIVDPPAFASRAGQVQGALSAYGRLTELAVELVESGGWLVQASCSAQVRTEEFFDVVTTSVTRAGGSLSSVEHRFHGVDHPVGFAEGAYLKALLARVDKGRPHRRVPVTRSRTPRR